MGFLGPIITALCSPCSTSRVLQDRYGDYGLVACAFVSATAEAALIVECLRREINMLATKNGQFCLLISPIELLGGVRKSDEDIS